MDSMDPSIAAKSYCHGPPTPQSSGGEMPNKTKAQQLNSGNYINVVQMPVGVQYQQQQQPQQPQQQQQRRKYSPQVASEYQSRIFFGEYMRERCRDEFYAIPSTPVPAATDLDPTSVVSPTPPPQQSSAQQPQQNVPSVLYTVQRVVTTTSQIQQATGANYAVNSSLSNASNLPRSDVDCGMQNSPGPSTSTNYQSQAANTSSEMQQSACLANNYGSSGTTSMNYASTGVSSSASIPRPLQHVIPTCVYLMSRIAVHMEIEGTAQCPSQVMLAAALGCEELGIANKLLAQSIFGLWMTSSLLEIQLKPHHRPYAVRVAWSKLLERHSHGNEIERKYDEPMITLRRNVFFSKKDEEKIKDPRILELLYEEARHNVLMGRYIMEPAHSIMLGGIQARVELGPYNSHTHTIGFFRENQSRFLPPHVAKSSSWSWLPVSRKTSAEVRLLEQFKRVPTTATTRKLMRKYLEFCWALPFYGAAFFHGQVEQPVRGLMSLVHQKDISVLIAINEKGVFVIDHVESTLILGLRYEELSWDFAKPSSADDPECMPCIFIQFEAVENGIPVTKLMQIFSKQAGMMDALIAHFAEQMRRRRDGSDGQPPDNGVHDEPNPIQNSGNGVLSNKLSRLTLATFDDEGRCIGQMGSLSISY
ncbi:FERM domain-containing protein 8 [Lutzomyia longipalpis]|uniref:FERM domain-containing protein 8 n=1 Tax=Lutzomyia longipalpis TaxID=7200 RepID=UPI002483F5C2|nr:FERM domain-containing protein 8 [Lutzomyia longipalpis]